MKKIFLIFIALLFMFISCASTPSIKENTVPQEEVSAKVQEVIPPITKEEPVKELEQKEKLLPEDEVVAEFDGITITKKDKEVAKSEIEVVVSKLNKVTASRDYAKWYTFLSDDYRKKYSNPRELKETSKRLPGIYKGVNLKSLNDYFKWVFVPSRQQCRVDDIKYLSPTKVQVMKKHKNGFVIFYNLEKIQNKWLLVP